MNNFETFHDIVDKYLKNHGVSLGIITNLHDASINDADKKNIRYVYNGAKDLDVVDMDKIAKKGYKIIKGADGKDNIINTADAFLVNKEDEWFFVEFKDAEVKADNSSLKNSVLKKAYSNWYMLLDVLYLMREKGEIYSKFNFDNPIQFAKEHVHYILVCSEDKNYNTYMQIKNNSLQGKRYTPLFMQRLKDYLFKDAYVYTEQFFEREFVNQFAY